MITETSKEIEKLRSVALNSAYDSSEGQTSVRALNMAQRMKRRKMGNLTVVSWKSERSMKTYAVFPARIMIPICISG